MKKQIFVNLPVADLEKSKEFFQALGFSFNPQFTDEKGACLIIEEGSIYAMLITHEFFKTFTSREIADTSKVTEVLLALSIESREAVDEFADNVLSAGGKIHRAPEDHGWMYTRALEDLDGHVWEIFWMDPSQIPATN